MNYIFGVFNIVQINFILSKSVSQQEEDKQGFRPEFPAGPTDKRIW